MTAERIQQEIYGEASASLLIRTEHAARQRVYLLPYNCLTIDEKHWNIIWQGYLPGGNRRCPGRDGMLGECVPRIDASRKEHLDAISYCQSEATIISNL